MAELFHLVKGPQGDLGPEGYNEKWEDEAQAKAEAHRVALGAEGSEGNDTAIAGTPYTPKHYFDDRDGEVTAAPIFETS
jgi:hypothetical protein